LIRIFEAISSGVTRVQMKPGQLPSSKLCLLIIMIILIWNWHLTYLVGLDGAFIYLKVRC